MLTKLFRRVILTATHNPLVVRWVRRYGMRLGAARFVAGETLDECVAVLRGLNELGLATNTTLLGEGVSDESSTLAIVHQYERILDRIQAEKLQTNIALKLSHLGLEISQDLAHRNLERLVAHAGLRGNFIRIDMEESFRVDATLQIYRQLRSSGHVNVGIVLQSYLLRAMDDLQALLPLQPNLRLVKGAYLEPPWVALSKKRDVDRNYLEIAERALLGGCYTCIATHDERMINHVLDFAERQRLERTRFEFQMLYGIRQDLQVDLVRRGYKVLVATPFGPEWYFYLMRRLAERPANLAFILRNFRRSAASRPSQR